MTVFALVEALSRLLWSPPILLALLLAFCLITCLAGFPQRFIPHGMRTVFSGKKGVYRSLSVNLAAVLGVGNILGVAMAVTQGGPGAVFWCWLAGLLGVGVQYAECLFSLRYRARNADGRLRGGPMTAMRAVGHPRMAVFYAAAVCLGGAAMGAMTPANAMTHVLGGAGNSTLAAILIAGLTALVIFGGTERVFGFCASVMPPLVALYLLFCLSILMICRHQLPEALGLILREAFRPGSAAAGLTGYGIGRAARWGMARGLFSCEAGMGTAGISAASAGQGVAAETAMGCACSAVWDTLILATVTGIVFVAASLRQGGIPDSPVLLAQSTFSLIPGIGTWILPLGIAFFGFTTVIGWYSIAEQAYLFLTGGRGGRLWTFIWTAAVFLGGVTSLSFVWELSDIFCMCMLAPNLTAVADFLRREGNDTVKLRLLAGRSRRNKNRACRV